MAWGREKPPSTSVGDLPHNCRPMTWVPTWHRSLTCERLFRNLLCAIRRTYALNASVINDDGLIFHGRRASNVDHAYVLQRNHRIVDGDERLQAGVKICCPEAASAAANMREQTRFVIRWNKQYNRSACAQF